MKELQQHLTDNPQIENVYFNDNGGWIFGEGDNQNYPNCKTRAEILETKTPKKEK